MHMYKFTYVLPLIFWASASFLQYFSSKTLNIVSCLGALGSNVRSNGRSNGWSNGRSNGQSNVRSNGRSFAFAGPLV